MTARTLVVLRHAKAESPDHLADIDRPLTRRGHADAAAAGAWLAAQGLRPDLVLCSPARRTRETWHGVRVALGPPSAEAVFEIDLYEAGVPKSISLVNGVSASVGCVLLIGHNPTVTLLSTLLDPGTEVAEGLRTGGLAVHRLDGDWTDFAAGTAPLTGTHTARAAV
jgi:phosphohistidine phosphatase